MESGSSRQWGCASILLIFGILLLLLNLNILELGDQSFFSFVIPLILLFWGLSFLGRYVKNRRSGLFRGSFLTIYGGLLTTSFLGYAEFAYDDWWRLWPLLLIVLAVSIFSPKRKIYFTYDSDKSKYDTVKESNAGKIIRTKGFTVGNVQYTDDNWALGDMRMHQGVGNYYIDLSKAYVPEGESIIHLSGWVGNIKMVIPEDLSVKINAAVTVGEINVFNNRPVNKAGNQLSFKSADYDDAYKKVSIKVSVNAGSVRITHV
ncbi:hypothetical protein C4B60_03215 [Jeotgalibacillus proteolyticus]|uniref:Uncharacterized protein n=1 Tax=Jeotgalibacillus proteolyticus TaxID=2082395 RepID=A0A2S5GH70_9BACL|nr:hypothetical protein C4B60_03215 [Jeotgalibacillus proteolyticus]